MGKTKVKGVLIGKVGFGGNLDLSSLNDIVYYRESEVLVRVPEMCITPE